MARDNPLDVAAQIAAAIRKHEEADPIAHAVKSIPDDKLKTPGGTSGAPIDALYLVLALNAVLTNERRFVPGLGLSGTDGGANNDYDLACLAATVAQAGIIILGAQTLGSGVKAFTSIPILPASNPTSGNQAARKAYVDLHMLKTLFDANTFLYAVSDNTPVVKTRAEVMALLSGQAAADFSLNTHKLTAVVDPTANQHGATKKYVDDRRSRLQYVFVPDAAAGADVDIGDQQGAIHHSGPDGDTATRLYVDCETAPGTSVVVTVQYGNTDDLDTVASWTTIATVTASGKTSIQNSMTNASIPADRLIRMNVGTITGTDPKDMTVTLRTTRTVGA